MAGALTIDDLERMDQRQLDELFARSPAGPVPAGEGDGTVLFAPRTELEDVAAPGAHLLFWRGQGVGPAPERLASIEENRQQPVAATGGGGRATCGRSGTPSSSPCSSWSRPPRPRPGPPGRSPTPSPGTSTRCGSTVRAPSSGRASSIR